MKYAACWSDRRGLKQTGEEGGDGSFDAQDALAELDGVQPRSAEQIDLVRNPATFRADRQRYRLLDGARARREVARVPDQPQCSVDNGGQPVFNERLEAFLDDDLGQDAVAGLFQA